MKVIAKALILNDKSEILLLRRSQSHPHYPHHLDLPGGEVESSELPLDAVRREIGEETGLVVERSLIKLAYEKSVNRSTQHLIYVVGLTKPAQAIKLSWEHDAYFWMTSSELLSRDLPDDPDDYFLSALEFLNKNDLKPGHL